MSLGNAVMEGSGVDGAVSRGPSPLGTTSGCRTSKHLPCALCLPGSRLQKEGLQKWKSIAKEYLHLYNCVCEEWLMRSLAEGLHLSVLVLALASQDLGGEHSDPGGERRNHNKHPARPFKPPSGG